MKRIIGIPWGKKDKTGARPPPPQKPPAPGLTDIVAKTDAKADDLDKKILACENQLRKIGTGIKTSSGSTKSSLTAKANIILQRKKKLEQQAESLRQQSFNIEQTTVAIDSTKDAITTVKTMKKAAQELKKVQKKVHVESVEDLHEELEQLFETSDDVQEALANKLNMPEVDDQELEEQLELLGEDFVADTDASYLDAAAGWSPSNDDPHSAGAGGSLAGPGPSTPTSTRSKTKSKKADQQVDPVPDSQVPPSSSSQEQPGPGPGPGTPDVNDILFN